MKLLFKVLSVTTTAAEEVVRLVPLSTDKTQAGGVVLQRGSTVTIIIQEQAQWGQHKPDQVVSLAVTAEA